MELATLIAAIAAAVLALLAFLRAGQSGLAETERRLREEIERLRAAQDAAGARGRAEMDRLRAGLAEEGRTQRAELARLGRDAGTQQEALRRLVQERLDRLNQDNAEKLEAMRRTVDEKLEKTLHERLGASFGQVSEQLERVHRSVGEMQTLATGVGDLKRVLTNVKTRGTWGEVSLGALLHDVLAPDQIAQNVEIEPGTRERVEYAIRLPGDGDRPVWLPLDAKFPQEDYERLQAAADLGDAGAVETASAALEVRVRGAARDIRSKYVKPPHSTDFGILFLPTEGLYAEVVRRPGLVDALQREERVIVAGPTTLLSILSSLRMGFRTLAIQQKSSEVWQVLGAVKTEFGKFGGILDKVEKKLQEAQNTISDSRVRQRAVDRKLKDVEALEPTQARALLELTTVDED